jgi:glycerol transport system ATP-binding protein
MIYVTHDQTEALTFADKVVVMYEGEVVQIGTPAELFERPKHTFVGYFIGSPGMNVMPAEVSGREARVDGQAVALGASYRPQSGRVEIGVRPEFISLVDDPAGLPVQVRAVEDVGRYRIVRARLGSNDINVVLKEGVPIPAEPRAVLDLARVNVYVDSHLVEPEAGA